MGNQYKTHIKRLFATYAITVFMILFILIGIFLYVNINVVISNANKKQSGIISEIIDQQLCEYIKKLESLSIDEDIIQVLNSGESSNITNVNRKLYEYINSQRIKANFALVDGTNKIISSNLYEGNQKSLISSRLYRRIVDNFNNTNESFYMLPDNVGFNLSQVGALVLATPVKDKSNILGYIIFDIQEEDLYNLIKEYSLDDVIITDRYDNLIFSLGRQSRDPLEKYPAGKLMLRASEDKIVSINNKKFNTYKRFFFDTELIMYTFISVEFSKLILSYSLIFLILTGTLLSIMLPWLVKRINKNNLSAIDNLEEYVDELGRGNIDFKIKEDIFEEFKKLADAFKNVVFQKEELIKNNNELAERKRIMEIRQLKEQFNPHFVFNVMETIRYEIIIDASKASEMVLSFANLMRYSTYYGDSIVCLSTDIEYINDYLLLQKMRYNKRLEYTIDIPPEVMNCKIPKLLIQPIVENSLVHGMKNVKSIRLNISARKDCNKLKLCVVDNGEGIEENKLMEIRALFDKENIIEEHIGIYNTHRVIQLTYGKEYGVEIESKHNEGTKITLLLPLEGEVCTKYC